MKTKLNTIASPWLIGLFASLSLQMVSAGDFYRFNSSSMAIETTDGFLIVIVEGVSPEGPQATPGFDMADAVEFRFPASLNFDADDVVEFVGNKPIRLVVDGDLTMPAGMSVKITAGGGEGGDGSDTGGSGGFGNWQGFGGDRGKGAAIEEFFFPGANGEVGKVGKAGLAGEQGTGTDGTAGWPGSPGGLHRASGAAGTGGAAGGATISSGGSFGAGGPVGADGSPGGDGLPGGSGVDGGDGLTGGGGSHVNPLPYGLRGGGGGASGSGGSGGGGGGGGAGGGGGGGAGWIFSTSGGWGGVGGRGGKGGNGAVGPDGGKGGNGGGALELRATRSLIIRTVLNVGGADGEPSPPLDDEVAGKHAEAGAAGAGGGFIGTGTGVGAKIGGAGGSGGNGGDGGDAGAGGSGGGGAGGTIILSALWFDFGRASASSLIDVSGGNAGDGDPSYQGDDGTFVRVLVDDYADSAASAEELPLGIYEGVIGEGTDADWVAFRLDQATTMTIYTTGSLDTVGSLYKEGDPAPLATVDDYGGNGNLNFLIHTYLEAGLYYVRTEAFSTGTGFYTLHLEGYDQDRLVNTTADEDDIPVGENLSLREAIRDSTERGRIRFDPTVFAPGNDNTITLTKGPLLIEKSLIIDAYPLLASPIIDANGASTGHRVLKVRSDSSSLLTGLTLTGGRASGTFPDTVGGAIYNDHSELRLFQCTLHGNTATGAGGAIYNDGYQGEAGLTLDVSTISGNHSDGAGGAIYNDGQSNGDAELSIYRCTIAENIARGEGGGIYNDDRLGGRARVSLEKSILAGNTATLGQDDFETTGASIQQIDANQISGQAWLAPLGDYGGPALTMPPIPGSPAINAATPSEFRLFDQRRFPRGAGGLDDLGAVEIQGTSDANKILAAIWETDDDGDGRLFGLEFVLGTNPFVADPVSHLDPSILSTIDGQLVYYFTVNPNAIGNATWIVELSTDLDNWIEIYRSNNPVTGNQISPAPPEILTSYVGNGVLIFVDDASASEVFFRFGAPRPPSP